MRKPDSLQTRFRKLAPERDQLMDHDIRRLSAGRIQASLRLGETKVRFVLGRSRRCYRVLSVQ